MRFTHPLRGPSFGRRVLSATELPRAVARTGRPHLPVLKNEGYFLAERGRFELPVPTSGTTDFESAAFDHSATSP